MFHLPAEQTKFARAVFVHDDAERQRDGAEEEGADGERQVQHLILFFADGPALHLKKLIHRACRSIFIVGCILPCTVTWRFGKKGK